MWARIAKLLFKQEDDEEPSPQEIISTTIQEIDFAIGRNRVTLAKTQENEREIAEKMRVYERQLHEAEQKASTALRAGKERQAKQFLQEKKSLDAQFRQFAALYQNISNTVKQLEQQLQKLHFQREEIKSKQVVLTAQLESAKAQKNLNESLSELENTYSLELFEDEVLQMQLEAELTDNILNLDDEIETLTQEEDLHTLRTQLQEEEEAKVRAQQAAQFQKIQQLFSENARREEAVLKEKAKQEAQKKTDLLDAFQKEEQRTHSTQQDVEKEKLLDDFFNNEPPKETRKTEAEDFPAKEVEDFFKKDDKQQQMDDFFSD